MASSHARAPAREGTVPVREFSSAEAMREHYRVLRERTFPKPEPARRVPAAPAAAPEPAPEPFIPPKPEPPYVAALTPDEFALIRAYRQRGRKGPAPSIQTALASCDTLMRVAASVCEMSLTTLYSEQRTWRVAKARQIGLWLCRRFTLRSLTEIGRRTRRDHTTVLHAGRRVDAVIAERKIAVERDEPRAWATQLWLADWPTKTCGRGNRSLRAQLAVQPPDGAPDEDGAPQPDPRPFVPDIVLTDRALCSPARRVARRPVAFLSPPPAHPAGPAVVREPITTTDDLACASTKPGYLIQGAGR